MTQRNKIGVYII